MMLGVKCPILPFTQCEMYENNLFYTQQPLEEHKLIEGNGYHWKKKLRHYRGLKTLCDMVSYPLF